MLFLNLKSRVVNKAFWLGLIGWIITIAQLFGFDATEVIPKNYVQIINSVFGFLIFLGIAVDTSTPGISDKIVQDATVQAINNANDVREEIKTEATTTSINNTITENSQDGSVDTAATSSDKESVTSNIINTSGNTQVSSEEPNASNQVEDVAAIKAERDALKAKLDKIQTTVVEDVITPSNN